MLWLVLGSLNRLLERIELTRMGWYESLAQTNRAQEAHHKGKNQRAA